ncbi:MAG: PQQ-binding-like beta-propeller repeat protein [Pirellulales bacterium]
MPRREVGHDAVRSGATATQIDGPFARKWYRAFPDEGITAGVQSVIDDDHVYLGTLRGVVHAIDADGGNDVWTRNLGAPLLHTCAVGDGHVFVGAGDGKLYALSAAGLPSGSKIMNRSNACCRRRGMR